MTVMTRLAVAALLTAAVACGGRDAAEPDVPPTATPGEAAATTGTLDPQNERITIAGCLTKDNAEEFVLTSADDAIVRQERGTSGFHQDPDTRLSDANRGLEEERARHSQNPSAEFGRYRLEGEAERLSMHLNREVEIQGEVLRTDGENSTPAVVRVEAIDATGARCGNN